MFNNLLIRNLEDDKFIYPLIEGDSRIGNNVVFYSGVIIEAGAEIGDNVILGYREQKGINDLTVVGENVRIRSGAVIYHGCRIGANSQVGHNSMLRERTIIGHDSYFGPLSLCEGDTTIGNHCGIHSQNHITKFCEIGDYTFIAPMFVGANDNAITHRRIGHGENNTGFKTGRGVRIAVGVTLLPGIEIGNGAVIGAGSLVTGNVPPYVLVMGSPARIVDRKTSVDLDSLVQR